MNRREVLYGSSAVSATWLGAALFPTRACAQSTSGEEARAIAKEAYVYGFPLVDSYRIQYSYFVDRGGAEFKAPWNTIFNNARVYTPDDKAIQTPNSDTPYSYVGADLRAEPLVLSVPALEKGRYYSLQFIDMYTFNERTGIKIPTGTDTDSRETPHQFRLARVRRAELQDEVQLLERIQRRPFLLGPHRSLRLCSIWMQALSP